MKPWLTKLALTALTAATLIVPSAATYASSSKLYVDDDKQQCKTAQFTTIQAAVDAAKSGDTVYVCSGVYTENVTITKKLTLRSQVSKGQTLPLLENVVDDRPIIDVFNTKDVTIRDLRLVGTPNNLGIAVTGAPHITMQDLNLSSFNIGIFVRNQSDKTVVENSTLTSVHQGILFLNTRNVKASKNTVTASRDAGIQLSHVIKSTVSKNIVTDNQGNGIAIEGDDSKDNTFDGNTIKRSGNFDALDATVGTKTANTANTWKKNTCVVANSAELCTKK